jgi:Uma2 family endonuclease
MKQVPLTLRRSTHPSRPVLVVEVAESSLSFDREDKGGLYARAGIRDYWIVNLVDPLLEVYRDPGEDPTALYGSRYRRVERLGPGETVSPLALATVRLAVGDLLP